MDPFRVREESKSLLFLGLKKFDLFSHLPEHICEHFIILREVAAAEDLLLGFLG